MMEIITALVQIGDQVWMKENLKVTHYADGTLIPMVEGKTEWIALTETSKAYCWYDNSTTNRDIYGGLYNWAGAMNGAASSDDNPSGVQGVCPDGWHIPSDSEWKKMEMYLGMSQGDADIQGYRGTDEGDKLKEAGNTHWTSLGHTGTNESGFTALPGGHRYIDGVFTTLVDMAFFGSSTEIFGNEVLDRRLHGISSEVGRYNPKKNYGLSVRCVKD